MEMVQYAWAAYGSTFCFILINTVLALSTYATLSAGVFSFATVVFAACGGFAAAHMVAAGYPVVLVLLGAGVVGAMLSAFVVVALARLESHWLALASLALVLITRVVVLNMPSVTGGVNGKSIAEAIHPAVLIAVVVVIGYGFHRLRRSWYGMASAAVREDHNVAAAMGINPARVRMIAFVISGAVGGVGGAMLAMTLQFISPDTYFVGLAFSTMAAAVLGGYSHWAGALVGAAIYTALPSVVQTVIPDFEDIAKGVVLLLVMVYLPRGIVDPSAWRRRRDCKERPVSERQYRDAGS